MEQSKFIVLPEQKLVVCILEVNEGSFRGTAKCSPEDTFDEKIGKRIAYLRADNKRKRSNVNELKNFRIAYLDSCIERLMTERCRLEKSVNKNLIAIASNSQEIEKLG